MGLFPERKLTMFKVEIRAAEGGEDAKLLVDQLFDIYMKTAKQESF